MLWSSGKEISCLWAMLIGQGVGNGESLDGFVVV